MVRFDGKSVLMTNVSKGINEPETLIQTVIDGKAPKYKYEGGKTTESNVSEETAGHQIYKHLMNGVSYMLPFVIGGGIMIALAFLIDTVAGAPKDSSFGTYTAAAAFFKTVGGYAFSFMLPVLAGYIARSIADRPGLAVGFVGGYIVRADRRRQHSGIRIPGSTDRRFCRRIHRASSEEDILVPA